MNVVKARPKTNHVIPDDEYEDYREFYGDDLGKMIDTRSWALDAISKTTDLIGMGLEPGVAPIMYVTSRLKSPDSMRRKLVDRGLAVNPSNATRILHDAVGCRIVCSFTSDVYRTVSLMEGLIGPDIIEEKDYIANPKPSGYRSYHLIIRSPNGVMVEVQVRTLAMDSWAALEHQLNYKHEVHDEGLRAELRKCAAGIAEVDQSMQSMKDRIMRGNS